MMLFTSGWGCCTVQHLLLWLQENLHLFLP